MILRYKVPFYQKKSLKRYAQLIAELSCSQKFKVKAKKVMYVIVIAWDRVQYEIDFPSSDFYFIIFRVFTLYRAQERHNSEHIV